jgi:hypothetical protein
MKEAKMKKTIYLSFIISLLLTFSCNEYSLQENIIIDQPKVLAVQVDPPVSCPGCDITISVLTDRGDSNYAPFMLKIGNRVLENGSENNLGFTLPKQISEVFGDNIARQFREKGYVDVPIEVELQDSLYKASKLFRIAHSDYEEEPFDINPVIKRVTYKIDGSAQEIDIDNYSTVVFKTGTISGEVTFEAKNVEGEELVLKEYEYSWLISSSSDEIPELLEMDEKTGKAEFLFKDVSGTPVVGKFRFTLIIKPKKSYADTGKAKYGTDFHTFVFDTTGGSIETEE